MLTNVSSICVLVDWRLSTLSPRKGLPLTIALDYTTGQTESENDRESHTNFLISEILPGLDVAKFV